MASLLGFDYRLVWVATRRHGGKMKWRSVVMSEIMAVAAGCHET